MLDVISTPWPEMPSGVAVTPSGRIFLCFPRWLSPWGFTLAELRDGKPAPFPDHGSQCIDLRDPVHRLFSVQSVVATEDDTLWALDTGRPFYAPAIPGAAKLVAFDVATGRARKTFVIPHPVARRRTYLNDVRIDLARGKAGTAFITDSGTLLSPCALIVVDLATGRKLRRLDGDRSVQPELGAVPTIEGRKLLYRVPFTPFGVPYQNGVDGIALDATRKLLYYCPLSSRVLYSVEADLLADPAASDEDVARSIREVDAKPISDGLECDGRGVLYTGDLEHGRVVYRDGSKGWRTLVADSRLLWIDTLCAAQGFLYFTVSQIERLWPFSAGRCKPEKPYSLFRVPLPS